MTSDVILFAIVALTAIGAAVAMIMSRNAVYSALFLILNFLAVAVFYLVLGAPFLALAQITVYAGAIVILFLFVIMLLGAEKLKEEDPVKWQRPAAIIVSLALAAEGTFAIFGKLDRTITMKPFVGILADPVEIGIVLFDKFALPFEITSLILLVAVIGVVVLSKAEKKEGGK
ncbi:NADH-quinone oxidoreductase subunit J [bacterium]|nr:MAG: NADH-quinone oxidoreductase subunit J [bacterium]